MARATKPKRVARRPVVVSKAIVKELLDKLRGLGYADVPKLQPEFGDLIGTIRRKLGVTHEELAVALDVKALTIARWEGKANAPRVKQVRAIRRALGLSEIG